MAYYRVISRVNYWVQPPRGAYSACLHVRLDRSGMPADKHQGNGRPRPPVRRTIDLRVGDEILVGGRWRRIVAIDVEADGWFEGDDAATWPGDGYIYRPTAQPLTLPRPSRTSGGLRREGL